MILGFCSVMVLFPWRFRCFRIVWEDRRSHWRVEPRHLVLVVIPSFCSVSLIFLGRHPCMWIVYSQQRHCLELDCEHHLVLVVFLQFGSSALQVPSEGQMKTELRSQSCLHFQYFNIGFHLTMLTYEGHVQDLDWLSIL